MQDTTQTVTIEPHTPTLDPFGKRDAVWYVLAFGDGTYHRSGDTPTDRKHYATMWPTKAKARKAAETNGYRVR